jgi:MFS family permease
MEPDARRTRIAVATAFAAQGLGFAVLISHLPAFKDRYGIGDNVVTAIVFGVALLAGAGTAAADQVSARRGSGAGLRLALLTVAVAVGLIAVAPDLLVLCVGFAVYGLGVGGVDATMNMQAVALQHRYGRSILTSFHAAWSAGGIVGALYTAGTEHLSLWLPGVLLAAGVVILAIAVYVGGRLAPATGQRGEAAGAIGAVEGPKAATPWRPILVLGLAVVCFYVADSGTSTWSSDYLREVLHASKGVAPLALAAYLGSSLVSRLVGDHAVRRWGRLVVVRAGGVVGALGLLLVVVAHQSIVAIAGFTILGLGVGIIAPLSFSAAGELSPGDADTVVAQVNVFNYVGFVVGGAVVGLFGSAGVLRAGFIVPLVLTLVIAVIAPVFQQKSREAVPEAAP